MSVCVHVFGNALVLIERSLLHINHDKKLKWIHKHDDFVMPMWQVVQVKSHVGKQTPYMLQRKPTLLQGE